MSFDFAAAAAEINKLQDRVNKIQAIADAKTEPLEKEITMKQEALQQAMESAGLKEFKDGKSVAEIKTSLRVGIKDYAAFEQFVYRKKALHLMERRVGIVAYREMKDALGGKPIPGTSEFNQTKLHVKPSK